MLGVAGLGRGAAHAAAGIDEVLGIQGAAAVVALVAAGFLVATVGAGTLDITVGQEAAGLGVVELRGRALIDVAVLHEAQEDVVGDGGVVLRAGVGEEVERDAELAPVAEKLRVELVDDLLGRAALVVGADGDGRAVRVATGDHQDVVADHAVVTGEDIGGEIRAGDVAEVE